MVLPQTFPSHKDSRYKNALTKRQTALKGKQTSRVQGPRTFSQIKKVQESQLILTGKDPVEDTSSYDSL